MLCDNFSSINVIISVQQMQRAKEQIVSVQIDRQKVLMSIVQKQNEMGLSYNERIFILVQDKEFGYISKFKMSNNPKDIDLQKCKVKQSLKTIRKVTSKEDILRIVFSAVQQKKTIEKTWVLKMASAKLVKEWHNKFDQEVFKTKTKKPQIFLSPRKSQNLQQPMSRFDFVQKKSSPKIKPHIELLESRSKDKLKLHQPEKSKVQSQDRSKVQLQSKSRVQLQEKKLLKGRNNNQEDEGKGPLSGQIFLNSLYQNTIEEQRQEELSRSNHEVVKDQRQNYLSPPQRQQVIRLESQYTPHYYDRTPQNDILERNIKEFTRNSKNAQQGREEPYIYQNKPTSKKESMQYYQLVNKIVTESRSKSTIKQSGSTPYVYRDFNEGENINNSPLQKAHQVALREHKKQFQYIFPQQCNTVSLQNLKVEFKPTWTYQYMTQPHYQVFISFSQQCSQLMMELINNLGLKQRERKYSPKVKKTDFWLYYIGDIEVKLCMTCLREIVFENQNVVGEKICDASANKAVRNQFKNYHALYQAIHNMDSIMVPLACIVEYKGFAAYFKATPEFKQNPEIPSSLNKELQRIENASKILTLTLTNQENTMILPLDKRFYSSVHSVYYQNRNRHGFVRNQQTQFEKYMIQQIQSYLPLDLLFQDKPNLNSRLRIQLVQNSSEDNQKFIGDRELTLSKVKGEHIKEVQRLSKRILQSVSEIITSMDNLQFVPLNSKELSDYLHINGVNLRYLSLIYQNLSMSFQKSIIASEIVGRTAKLVLRKTLQDIHLQNNGKERIDDFNEGMLSKVIDFMNCIVGNTYETSALWKVLQVHSSQYFNISFQPSDMHKGYFLLALVYHCQVKADWNKLNFEHLFVQNSVFNAENILQFTPKLTTYQPVFEEKYIRVMQLVQQMTEENFECCVKELDLHKYAIPPYFQMNGSHYRLKKFLTTFIHPQTVVPSQLKYTHLKLFQTSETPIREEVDIQLTQIKWYMRERKRDRYIKACDNFLRKVNKFYGDFHPLQAQIYDLFSCYHMNNGQYEDSITFSKSSLVTILKLCGTNHLKTSESYYQLALCYIKANKKQDAINHLTKAKNILQHSQRTESIPYAILIGKISLLQLNQNNFQDSIKLALGCLALLQKHSATDQPREDQKTQAYEILARCYQLMKKKDEETRLSEHCANKLGQVSNPLNLQRMLKICLYPMFSTLSPQLASVYLDIISQVPLAISTSSYGTAFKLIRQRIVEDSLTENMRSYLSNLHNIDQFVSANASLKKWNNFGDVYERQTVNDFLSLTEELLFFLGQGFVTGALRESL